VKFQPVGKPRARKYVNNAAFSSREPPVAVIKPDSAHPVKILVACQTGKSLKLVKLSVVIELQFANAFSLMCKISASKLNVPLIGCPEKALAPISSSEVGSAIVPFKVDGLLADVEKAFAPIALIVEKCVPLSLMIDGKTKLVALYETEETIVALCELSSRVTTIVLLFTLLLPAQLLPLLQPKSPIVNTILLETKVSSPLSCK
jgi:hypothetical protein